MVACVPTGRLVVGVDDSLNSLAALRRAAWSADRRQAELEIVHVIPEDSDARALEAADRDLAALVSATLSAGLTVPVRRNVVRGEPGEVLARLSAEAELLVIGACVNSERRGVFSGDVARVCLRNAACPVDICADHSAAAGSRGPE